MAAMALSVLVQGCGPHAPEVVVYTALDELYSKPILDDFEAQTGIHVRALYDTEASKTTGLVSRLMAERNRPRADVFWNNEVAQTILLKNADALDPYQSPSAENIPAQFKDSNGYWTGFAARARVIIYNTDLTDDPPRTFEAFTDPKWRGKLAIARPLFGTTATHAAALFSLWGDEKARAFLSVIRANDIAILAGNATVRDRVAAGEFVAGLTDTDDANGAVEDGKPVKWHFPDQGPEALGTLLIPNTVALIRGAPNADAGRQLIDYLLSPAVEGRLAQGRSIQIPLNAGVTPDHNAPPLDEIRTMAVDWDAVANALPRSITFVKETFVR
jgi:iron(III) transport system substrate-binding protein